MRTVERVSALKPPERARKAAERDARRAVKSMTRDRDIIELRVEGDASVCVWTDRHTVSPALLQ